MPHLAAAEWIAGASSHLSSLSGLHTCVCSMSTHTIALPLSPQDGLVAPPMLVRHGTTRPTRLRTGKPLPTCALGATPMQAASGCNAVGHLCVGVYHFVVGLCTL